MADFIPYDRSRRLLLPADLKDWIPEDDLAHFVVEAVERVSITAFKANDRGTGKAQYHPRMMLALLINCYANGVFSSRRIERATHRDVAVRFIAALLARAEAADAVPERTVALRGIDQCVCGGQLFPTTQAGLLARLGPDCSSRENVHSTACPSRGMGREERP